MVKKKRLLTTIISMMIASTMVIPCFAAETKSLTEVEAIGTEDIVYEEETDNVAEIEVAEESVSEEVIENTEETLDYLDRTDCHDTGYGYCRT